MHKRQIKIKEQVYIYILFVCHRNDIFLGTRELGFTIEGTVPQSNHAIMRLIDHTIPLQNILDTSSDAPLRKASCTQFVSNICSVFCWLIFCTQSFVYAIYAHNWFFVNFTETVTEVLKLTKLLRASYCLSSLSYAMHLFHAQRVITWLHKKDSFNITARINEALWMSESQRRWRAS